MDAPLRRRTKGTAVKYLLLIYTSETEDATRASDAALGAAVMAEYMTYTQDLNKAGKMVAGEALQPIATATTVRIRDGKTQTTDGPFAETKEQLGGFYLIEARDLDEALAWGARIPGARYGSIEVRPVVDFGNM